MRTREASLGQKLVGNTLFNFMGQAYVLILSFAVVPYVVHRLGAGLYGVVVMVQALGGFAGLLNLGIGRALTKYVSELYWQGNLKRISALFQTALATCLLSGLAGFLILIGPRRLIAAALFHGETSSEVVAQFALYIAAFGLLLSLLTESLSALPIALQRFDIYNRMNILTATVRNAGMLMVLAAGYSVKAVLLVNLISSLVALLGYGYFARKLIPTLSLRPKFAWPDLRQLLRFSGFVLVAGVSGVVVHRLDRVLVAYFLPIAALAFYAIPYSLADKTPLGVGNITSVIFPSTSELSAMQAEDKLRELYLRATKMVVLVGLPVTIVLVTLPGQILQYWVGKEFAVQGSLTLQLLAIGFLFNILAHVPFALAQGIGRPWISAKYSLINAAVNLLLFFILIPRLGIVGAGAGFLVSEIIVMPFFIREVNRLLNVSWRSLASRAYLRPLVCGLGLLAVLWVSRGHISSLLSLGAWCALGLCLYGLVALGGAFDARERVAVYSQLLEVLRLRRRAANA